MMKILITGGAGFIGSSLVDKLTDEHEVMVLDNLLTGKEESIKKHLNKENFTFVNKNILNKDIDEVFSGVDIVFHLAALSEIKTEDKNPHLMYQTNVMGTYNVLEAMRTNNIKKIVFASTQTVYGDSHDTLNENSVVQPISLYAASKVASEMLLFSYAHKHNMKVCIARLANVVGKRQNKGIVFDFVNKLKANRDELEILGDGNQTKSYIDVLDCSNALMLMMNSENNINIFNVGTDDSISAKEIADITCEELKLRPKYKFTGGKIGWKGDIPKMKLSIEKLKAFGWKSEKNSKQATQNAARVINDD
jgi:UDP-glucose 4-epimerase